MEQSDSDRVYKRINADFLQNIPVSKNPVVYITGGQPGSGKSHISKDIEGQSKEALVVVDADKTRQYHPDYRKLMQENDKTAADLTHADAGKWAGQLVRDAVHERKSLLIDQTSSNPEVLKSLAFHLKKSGYTVDIRLIAVPLEESAKRVETRYQEQKQAFGFGRYSNPNNQKFAFEGVSKSFEMLTENIKQASIGKEDLLVDRLSIYNKDGVNVASVDATVLVREAKEKQSAVAIDDALKSIDTAFKLNRSVEQQEAKEIVVGALGTIRLRDFNDQETKKVQLEAALSVKNNPEKHFATYLEKPQSFNGRYVCSDLFKETFDAYGGAAHDEYGRAARTKFNPAIHNSAAVLANEQFTRSINSKTNPEQDTVVFLTGSPGAGKTSSIMEGGALPDGVRVVYEGQLINDKLAIEKIQASLEAGLKPLIIAVHTKPEQALDNTFKRFDNEGRGASIGVMADIQGKTPDSLEKIRNHFGDKVALKVVDRTKDFLNPQTFNGWEHLHILKSEGNHEQISERLTKYLEQARSDERIIGECYKQAGGKSPEYLVKRIRHMENGEIKPHGERSSVSGTTNGIHQGSVEIESAKQARQNELASAFMGAATEAQLWALPKQYPELTPAVERLQSVIEREKSMIKNGGLASKSVENTLIERHSLAQKIKTGERIPKPIKIEVQAQKQKPPIQRM